MFYIRHINDIGSFPVLFHTQGSSRDFLFLNFEFQVRGQL